MKEVMCVRRAGGANTEGDNSWVSAVPAAGVPAPDRLPQARRVEYASNANLATAWPLRPARFKV